MNWETSRPLVIAHRGDTKAAVENTLPAVESALRMGVDGVEVDLQLTRDGEIVIFHDKDLKRLAEKDGLVAKTDLARLREIRLGQATIPTLGELLDLVGDKALLNLEMKSRDRLGGSLAGKLTDTLKSFHLHDSILVSSFHPVNLWNIKKLAPTLRRGYLFHDHLALHKRILPGIRPFSLHAPLPYVSQSLIHSSHQANRRFFVWTINEEDDMRKCIKAGVDGIITDEPQSLLALLADSGNP